MPERKATTEGGLSRGAQEALRAFIETNGQHCPAANHLPYRLLNQLPPAWRLAPTEYLFTSLRSPTVHGYDPRQLNPPARHIFYGLFKNRHHCSMKVCLCPITWASGPAGLLKSPSDCHPFGGLRAGSERVLAENQAPCDEQVKLITCSRHKSQRRIPMAVVEKTEILRWSCAGTRFRVGPSCHRVQGSK